MTPYARFLAACSLTNLGDGIALVAWTWIASLLTRDPVLIALVPAALKLPWVLFVLPAGVVTDRRDRQRLMLGADMVRALAYGTAALVLAAALPLPEAPLHGIAAPAAFGPLVALALVVGAAEVVRDNAAQTMVPALVPDAALERANGRLWAVESVAQWMLGPALAGLLLGLSAAVPFAVNAILMAGSAALLLSVAGDFRPAARETRNWRAELAEGWRLLIATPVLLHLAILTGLWNLGFEAMMVGLVLLVQERLDLGPWGLSVILGTAAAGGLLAGLVGERVVARIGRGRTMQVAMVMSLAFPLAAFSDRLWVIAAGAFLSEFWGITWNVVSVATRQRIVPRDLLGRLNATYRLFAFGMIPVGMLLSGMLVRLATPDLGREAALLAPFAMAGLLYAGMALGWWRWLGRAFTR